MEHAIISAPRPQGRSVDNHALPEPDAPLAVSSLLNGTAWSQENGDKKIKTSSQQREISLDSLFG